MPNASSLLLFLLLAAAPGFAGAQAPQAAPEVPGEQQDDAAEAGEEPAEAEPEDLSATGDAWVDAQLVDIGRYGRRYREAFIDELVRYRDTPRALVEALLDERGWEPGDVYFACSLAGVTGRSCRFIADRRGEPAATGWNALATELGAGAGSQEFERIRRGIVHSYGRWARPLELDAELARAFPDHGKPPAAAADSDD